MFVSTASAYAGAVLAKLKLKEIYEKDSILPCCSTFCNCGICTRRWHRHRPREFNPEENAIRRTNRLHEAVQLDSLQFQAVYIMYLSDAMTMQDSINARRERAERMREEGIRPQRRRPTEEQMQAERGLLQLQLPYTATLYIPNRTTAIELRSIITEDLPNKNYRCEFQSVELFLGILISTGAKIKIVDLSFSKGSNNCSNACLPKSLSSDAVELIKR